MRAPETVEEPAEPPVAQSPLRTKTTEFVLSLAEASFKRQAEHDESLWRSLPLFAAGLALATAVIGRASLDVPARSWTVYSIGIHALFFGSVAAFAWSCNWLWRIVRQRLYEYPAPDAEFLAYAKGLTAFHEGATEEDSGVDTAVLHDLRLEMIGQYGDAATANFVQNADRMKARSNALLYMMVGFVLAFAFQTTIFVHDGMFGAATDSGVKDNGRSTSRSSAASGVSAAASGSAEGTPRDGRSKLLCFQPQSQHHEEVMTKDRNPIPPTAASPVARPASPKPLILAKDHAMNEGVRSPGTDGVRVPEQFPTAKGCDE